MRTIHRATALVLLLALLAGCGFKGDLVKSGEETPPAKEDPAKRDPVQG